jgi:hypothetical protein
MSYGAVLGYVGGSRKRYGEFLTEGIRKGYDTPWDRVKGQVVLGEENFVERMKSKVNGKGSKREQPAVRRFQAKDLKTCSKPLLDISKSPRTALSADGRRSGINVRSLWN